MKVILLEDVKSVGKKGDLVELKEGYARNFIIPKKLGVEATDANMNTLKLQKKQEEKLAREQLEAAERLAKELDEMTVKLEIKGGEGGKVFGSVSSKEIAKEIARQYGKEVDKKKIQLSEAIKTEGMHEVTVKLHPKVTAKLRVQVTAVR
ncbi:MAG: 50S ribosomal protein L9 [Lachnospiraceae bacterium]|nr:50S ribosomal protein L9 [Lachnospiraceae bacterium]